MKSSIARGTTSIMLPLQEILKKLPRIRRKAHSVDPG